MFWYFHCGDEALALINLEHGIMCGGSSKKENADGGRCDCVLFVEEIFFIYIYIYRRKRDDDLPEISFPLFLSILTTFASLDHDACSTVHFGFSACLFGALCPSIPLLPPTSPFRLSLQHATPQALTFFPRYTALLCPLLRPHSSERYCPK